MKTVAAMFLVLVLTMTFLGFSAYFYGKSQCVKRTAQAQAKQQSASVATAHRLNVQAQAQQQKAAHTLQERIHAIQTAHGACLDARIPDGL